MATDYQKLERQIRRLAMRWIKRPEEAEEIVQDALILYFQQKNAPTVRWTVSRAMRKKFGSRKGKHYDLIRRLQIPEDRRLTDDGYHEREISLDTAPLEKEMRKSFWEEKKKHLEPITHAIVSLITDHQFKPGEVAKVFNLAPSAINYRLRKLRAVTPQEKKLFNRTKNYRYATRVFETCMICQKQIELTKSRYLARIKRNTGPFFCSQRCLYESRKHKMKNYKGG